MDPCSLPIDCSKLVLGKVQVGHVKDPGRVTWLILTSIGIVMIYRRVEQVSNTDAHKEGCGYEDVDDIRLLSIGIRPLKRQGKGKSCMGCYQQVVLSLYCTIFRLIDLTYCASWYLAYQSETGKDATSFYTCHGSID
jgi:hypothetical protein